MRLRNRALSMSVVAAALLTAAMWVGCSDDDSTDEIVTVEISGDHGVVEMGTLSLSAATINGTDSGYTWASDDENVATVDASGMVTAVSAGEATISATGADTGATGTHAVVVIPAGSGGPVVVVTGDVFLKKGTTSAFSAATVNGTDSGYEWGSSDGSIATVDVDTGEVTALNPGEVTIEATGMDTLAMGSLAVHVNIVIPNEDDWLTSGHANYTADAFNHWNEDGEVSASCARCHGGSAGYRDYLGDDGTTAFQVDNPAPLGGVVDCNTCHNPTAMTLSTVIFPSTVQVDDLGPEARCMTCHQGRASTDDVEANIDSAADPDVVDANLGFTNIHYDAAGATLYAGRVRGGLQYDGMTYDWRFRHVPGYDNCVGCHDPHTLEVKISECASCHTGVTTVDDIKDVRMISSLNSDYDGDGDTAEGVFYEIEGLRTKLYTALQSYGNEVSMTAICYEAQSYPYFFIDTDASGGPCDASEASYPNKYNAWTPRLVRAAYNYQVSVKDPGAHAHNAKYIIQLLFDSITDLNTALTTTVDMSTAVRNDMGHFNGAGEAARHWDEDDAVSASCSKCHGGAEGFRFFLQYGVGGQNLEQDNGLDCATCHNDLTTPTDTVAVNETVFPGDVTYDLGDTTSNMCGTCHSGRESKSTVDARIASSSFSFRNVHYLAAAASKAGTNAQVGYEYDWQTLGYAGAWTGHPGGNACTSCHNPASTNHSFSAADAFAATGGCGSSCHSTAATLHDIRIGHTADYDGDSNSTEPLADEIATLADSLGAEIATYATAGGTSICYEPDRYPYFFIDTDSSGFACDLAEANYGNRYQSWDPTLMRAAFNYQFSQKEPGAWAHNFDYMVQLLIDSIDDLGGDISSYTRP